MGKSSRALAREWPYPRHRHFVRRLRDAAAAWFKVRDYPVSSKYPYILADRELWPKNIVVDEVSTYISGTIAAREEACEGFALHKYVHHGLSSQALVFNLIGPLIVSNDLEPLVKVLSKQGVSVSANASHAEFEFENRSVFNEDSGQPTSIDLVLGSDANNLSVFVESKFVEQEFGGCSLYESGDCDGRNPASDLSTCYLHHIGRKYWTLMDRYGFLNGQLATALFCPMATNYQYFRELLFSLEYGGSFVLICDERSPTFSCDGPHGRRGLAEFLLSLSPLSVWDRVAKVTIQDLVFEIGKTGRHPWITEFMHKYGMSSDIDAI